jgi:uncharacterized protein (DUF2147 family)
VRYIFCSKKHFSKSKKELPLVALFVQEKLVFLSKSIPLPSGLKNVTMKKILLTISLLFFTSIFYSQSVIGKWRTIDDETGQAKSIVEIYEKSGKIYGKVLEILEVKNRDRVCENCSGTDKNKPILGMTVIKGLTKDGEEYNSGKILDPKNGKLYKCYITIESKDKLKLRGYIGIAIFGRTQYWYRVK